MNRVELVASLALWRTREERLYRSWRRTVKKYKKGDPRRARAFAKYHDAVLIVRRRVSQLSKLPVTELDHAGEQFIMQREGVVPHAYNDSRNNCTYGVGHLIHFGSCKPTDYKKFGSKNNPGTDDEAIAFFRRDVRPYEAAVRKVFKGAHLAATHNRFNACVSLCLNVGINGFLNSAVARAIKAGNAKAAAEAILLWNKPPEIQGRRNLEFKLFRA